MIVTLILGILAMLVAPPLSRAREKSMVAATKGELYHATRAIDRYVLLNESWPTSVEDLRNVGYYYQSENIKYCTFQYTPASGGQEATVRLEAMHLRSKTLVTTVYPTWGGRMEESQVAEVC
ncbi:MAG: hypothetical protein HY561_02895 [Gemmatimonadetes bacterium]|nr:hypothetical protein [Gemmatimonadota bacterium]